MNGGILPLLILCLTAGLVLAMTRARAGWHGLGAMAVAALLASMIPFGTAATNAIFVGVWLSIIATALLVYLPHAWPRRWALAAAVNAGGWAGALASLGGMRWGLALALLVGTVFVPGRWVVARGHDVAIKVVASWMIAVAALALFVSMTPHPGYVPDHME